MAKKETNKQTKQNKTKQNKQKKNKESSSPGTSIEKTKHIRLRGSLSCLFTEFAL